MNEAIESTRRFYDENAAEWAAAHDTNRRFWGKEIYRFAGYLYDGDQVLDAGCGHGRDVELLTRAGLKCMGVDLSIAQLIENRRRNPKTSLAQANLNCLPFPSNTFDGFWASAVLLHIPKSEIHQPVAELQRVTDSNGIGFIAVKEGYGEKTTPDGRFWAYYQLEEFKETLEDSGLQVLESYRNPRSERTTFLVFFVRNLK